MKKMLVLVAALCLLSFPVSCLADWSITVSWTKSAGPNLAKEECLLDGAVKCTVMPGETTSCQFNVTNLSGQKVVVRSTNSQGGYSETAPVTIYPVPAPATGVLINITFVSP